MSRVALAVTPWYRLLRGSFSEMPLGLCSLAGYLNRAGHEALVFNADFEPRTAVEELDQRQMFLAYREYRKVLSDPEHPIWIKTVTDIEALRPDVLGMSVQVGSFGSVRMVATLFRERNPRVPIVVGGPMASVAPEECMEVSAFDYAVAGEGELPLTELVSALEHGTDPSGIAGLIHRRDGKTTVNPRRSAIEDLDGLPFPDRKALVNLADYPTEGLGLLFTARGCPFKCAYCAASAVWGRRVRFRSPENVMEELRLIYHDFGVRRFTFKDDTFTARRERIAQLCDMIKREMPDVTWSCLTRGDCVDGALVRKMARSGCRHVELGLESGCPEILETIGKGETVEEVAQAALWFRREGIATALNIILGFPQETPAQMRQSLSAALAMKPSRILVSLLSPYPGTEMRRRMLETGEITDDRKWEEYFHASGAGSRLHADPEFARTVDEVLETVERYNRSRWRRLRGLMRLAVTHPDVAGERIGRRLRPATRNAGKKTQ